MSRAASILLLTFLFTNSLSAQVGVEGSAGLGLAIPNDKISAQLNGNAGGTGLSSYLFATPTLPIMIGVLLDGEPFAISAPYNEKVKPGFSWMGNASVRPSPHLSIGIGVTRHRFKYSGLADLSYYSNATGEEESYRTYLTSGLTLTNISATVGYETTGPFKIGIHAGPLLQLQHVGETQLDFVAFETIPTAASNEAAVGVHGRVSIAQSLNPRDDLTLSIGMEGASLNHGHPDDGLFNITSQVHLAYRHSFTKATTEEPRVPPAEYFMDGVYSGCYGSDPEREIDSLLHLVDSLGKELNDAVDELEKNGFAQEIEAIKALIDIAKISSSSGGLSQAVVRALGDYIQCNNAAMEELIRSGSSGAGQVIKGMKFLKDILEFIAENNKDLTNSEKKLLKKIAEEVGNQLDALEKALEDKNVEQAIAILKSIKEGLPDGWPDDLLERFAKNLLKEIEDAIAESGPKAAKKILEVILKKITGSGAAAASIAEDIYNFIDLIYRLAVYYDALEAFNEAFVTLLQKLKDEGKGLESGLTCHTNWGGQDKRITKLVTEFEIVCWCPEEPGSKTEGEWKSALCVIEPSDATNPYQHTHPIGSGSFGSKDYKVHFPAELPCDSDLCYLKHTVYGFDNNNNKVQEASTFLGAVN